MAGIGASDAWEYLTLPEAEADQDQLTTLGHDGWELVTRGHRSDEPILYFKRRPPSFREVVTLDQRRSYYDSVERERSGAPREA